MTRTIWDLGRRPRVPPRQESRRGRRLLRFSLRWLLVLSTIFAIVFAIMAKPIAGYRREALAAKSFAEQGATLDWHNRFPRPLHRTLLYEWGIKKPYRRVTSIHFRPQGTEPSESISLDGIDQFKHLRSVTMAGCALNDEEFRKVAGATGQLRNLDIRNNPDVTDESFERLIGRHLEVRLTGTKISNAALRRFHAAKGVPQGSIPIAVRGRIQREFPRSLAVGIGDNRYGRQIYDHHRRIIPPGTVSVSGDFARTIDLSFIPFVCNEAEIERLWLSLHYSQLSERKVQELVRLQGKLQRLSVQTDGAPLESVLKIIRPITELEVLEIKLAKVGDGSPTDLSMPTLKEFWVNGQRAYSGH